MRTSRRRALAVALLAVGLAPAAAESEPPDVELGEGSAGAEAEAAAAEAVEAGDEDGSLAAALPLEFDARRLDECSESPRPVLNEICAVGTECDDDVRVADFVEVYNPNDRPVNLGCFVLAGREGVPFIPDGTLEPGGVRAWGEGELSWRIRKGGDAVRLLRVTRGADAPVELVPLESVVIDAERAHVYRSPDGGSWMQQGATDAEYGRPGTYGEPNPTAPPR